MSLKFIACLWKVADEMAGASPPATSISTITACDLAMNCIRHGHSIASHWRESSDETMQLADSLPISSEVPV